MGGVNLKIALTGAMGSGKSLVAEIFREQGARIVDADEISRSLLEPDALGWRAIRAEFGDRFFNAGLTVDRKKLRAAIFNDEPLRNKVNSILHPLIRHAINDICLNEAGFKSNQTDVIGRSLITVVEVPLLFEVGWQEDFDLIIVVSADDETCLTRVMSRDGVDRQAALAAFATQMGLAEKARMADHVIDNSGDIAATARQVKKLYVSLST
jgi:dephospho-CoA kinase